MQHDFIDLSRLKGGQILARKYVGSLDRWAVRLDSPYTDFLHYAIIAFPVKNQNDWYTFDATVRSPMTLIPLSKYRGKLIRIYSPKDGSTEFAYREARQLYENKTLYERFGGWSYIIRILPSLLKYWLSHGPRPVPWYELPNVDLPDRINCLVLIRRCYPNLIPADHFASAGAFEQAYRDGKLVLEQEGIVA